MGRAVARSCAVAHALCLLCCASGCVSYGSHLGTAPLPSGSRELSLAADGLLVDRGLGPQLLPNPEVGYRIGVGHELDVGARLNVGSLELSGRWRFLQGDVSLALVQGLGFGFVPVTNRDTGLFNAHWLTSLLVGTPVTRTSELVFGVRGAMTYAFPLTAFRGDASEATTYWLGGGEAGYRFAIGKEVYLFPQLTALRAYDTRAGEWLYPTLQGGVALQL